MEEISPNSLTFFDFQPMNLRFFMQIAEPCISIVLLKTSQRVVAPLSGMFLSFPLNAGSTRWEKTSPTGTVRRGVGFKRVFKTLTHLKVKSEICGLLKYIEKATNANANEHDIVNVFFNREELQSLNRAIRPDNLRNSWQSVKRRPSTYQKIKPDQQNLQRQKNRAHRGCDRCHGIFLCLYPRENKVMDECRKTLCDEILMPWNFQRRKRDQRSSSCSRA